MTRCVWLLLIQPGRVADMARSYCGMRIPCSRNGAVGIMLSFKLMVRYGL